MAKRRRKGRGFGPLLCTSVILDPSDAYTLLVSFVFLSFSLAGGGAEEERETLEQAPRSVQSPAQGSIS